MVISHWGTSIQGTPPFKGNLYSGDTSIQGAPLSRGHLYLRGTSIQGTPLFRRQLYLRGTSIQETPIQGAPLFSGHLYSRSTPIQWTPLFRGFIYLRDTSIRGNLYSRDTFIQRTQNLVLEKSSHDLWICQLYWRETSIQTKGTLFQGPETWVYPPFRRQLNPQKRLTTKNVDKV